MSYSNGDYLEMLLVSGHCNHNASAAVPEYPNRFPNQLQPDHDTFLRLVNRARETGSLTSIRKGIAGAPRRARQDDLEEEVLRALEEDPNASIRSVALACDASKSTTHRIIKANLHPYHYQRVQHLREEDFPRRVNFCQWLLNQNANNSYFSRHILFH
jgi:hypothetical protein